MDTSSLTAAKGSISAIPGKDCKPDGTGKDSKPKKKDALVAEARKMVALVLETVAEERKANVGNSDAGFSKISLKAFATSEHVTVEKFEHSGGVKILVSAIRKNAYSSKVADYGCRALAAITLYQNSAIAEMIKGGAIDGFPTVLDAQAEQGTENACVSVLKTIRNLTQTAENRSQIWKAAGIEAIVKAMNKHMDSARVLSHSSLVLSNLAFGNAEIKEAVGALGGISAICEGMKKHKDSQAVQARGCLALRNLCFQSDENQRIAGENGGAAALLDAIELYKEDREVVHQSCVALMNLSNVSEENRARIVEAKGGEKLVKLMQTYKDSSTVNDDCISIIRNIAVGSSAAQLEIGVNGGVASICEGMVKFPKNEKMAGKACTALRYLCFLPENRVKVHDYQGIEAIIGTLKYHTSNVGVVENALLAIGNATFESEENKTVVGKCGGIVVIINAVEQHRMNVEIQEHGCRVLRNLADGLEFNRRLEAESGGIRTAVFAMMGFPENASVQEQASAMLLNMSLSASNKEKMEEADVARLAEKAVNAHSKHRGVQLQAGSLLDRMNGYEVGGISGTSENAVDAGEETEGNRKGIRGLFSFSSRRGNRE